MPKTRFSSLDVRAIATQLQNTIVGYRIANVYDINAKTYLLKLAKPDSKLFLLIESGVRVHLSMYWLYAAEGGRVFVGPDLQVVPANLVLPVG